MPNVGTIANVLKTMNNLSDKKITGWWGGEPIWREKTPQEKLEENKIDVEVANLYIISNELAK